MKYRKTGVLGGIIWTFGERMFAQSVSAIVGIILARLLLPEDYGIISIVMVFINLCDVFVSSGFGVALVQKKDIEDEDYGTALTIGFCVSLLLYAVLFFASPYIAEFYDKPIIKSVIRVLGIRLIISSFNNIQQAICQRNMQFQLFFWSTSIGTFISGCVGVICAFKGFGVWALAAQYLTNSVIDTIVLNIAGKIRIKLCFSMKNAKEIFSFGGKVLCSTIVYTLDSQIKAMAVGKKFGASSLAYYDQGNRYPALLVTSINAAMQKVLLPAFSREQDDIYTLKETLRRSIGFSLFVLAPMLIGFFAVSPVFVTAVLTDKWLAAVPFMRIFCLYYLTRPYESSCHQALLAVGESGIVLKIMIAIDGTGLLLALAAIFILKNIFCVAIFTLVSTLISICCFSFYARKILGYKFTEQMRDVLPVLCISTAMGIIVYFVSFLSVSSYLILIIQVLVGMVSYIALAKIFKFKQLNYIVDKIKSVLMKGKTR